METIIKKRKLFPVIKKKEGSQDIVNPQEKTVAISGRSDQPTSSELMRDIVFLDSCAEPHQ